MNFKRLFDYSQPLVAAITILVAGLFIIVLYGSQVVYTIVKGGDTIEVTGSAKEAVIADTARLSISIEVKTGIDGREQGTVLVEKAVKKVTTYLTSQGLTGFETPAGTTNATYYYPQNSEAVQTGHSVYRSVVVLGTNIETLTRLANDLSVVSGEGYLVTSGGLELTYSKLDEIRVRLLTEAIKDATERAKAIALDSGRSVGPLKNAVGGVVQVLPQGGVDISDYGSYDTTSLNKEVMVTTRATFELK